MTKLFPTSFTSLLLLAFCTLASCDNQTAGPTVVAPANTSAAAGNLNIVFIRLDSLQTGYTALATELERLEGNAMAAQENIQRQIASLENDARSFQNKVQQGLIAPNQMQSEQQRLARKEQEIMQQRDMALGSIQQDQMQLQSQFGEKVKDILEVLKAEKGYDLIFNEGGGSALLMGNDALDVTPLVLERLNAEAVETETEEEEL